MSFSVIPYSPPHMVLGPMNFVTVGGMPAVQQTVEYSCGAKSLRTYRGYSLFSNHLKLYTMDVLDIIQRIEAAKAFAKEDLDTTFECETTREYRAYLKGQVDALDGVINHLQSYIEGQLSIAENTGE